MGGVQRYEVRAYLVGVLQQKWRLADRGPGRAQGGSATLSDDGERWAVFLE